MGQPVSIEHFHAQAFFELLLGHPMLLSRLRVLAPFGIRDCDDRLDDFSVAFQRDEAARVRGHLETLRSFPREEQTSSQRLSTDVLEWHLANRADGERFQLHDHPLNQLDGLHTRLPDFMLNAHSVNDVRDAQSYVTRLSRFGTAVDQGIESMRHRAGLGLSPPRFVLTRVEGDLDRMLAVPPDADALLTGFVARLDAVAGMGSGERSSWSQAARDEIVRTVRPAYARLRAAVRDLVPSAADEVGAWSRPDGEAYYAWLLRRHTTTSRSADEIHATGLAEVERVHHELRALLSAEGYATRDLPATLRALHREERFLYPDTDAGREAILADYAAIVAEVEPRLPEWFGRLPRAAVVVRRVPAFKEAGSAGAYYQPPPLDGSRPAVFFANLRSVREVAKFGMRTLACHEAVPGHHLQIALASEMDGVPLFRRVLPFTGFMEGWALYAERLAAEQGLLPTPFDVVGQLVAEVFRAVRLVVDTGLHARRWSREQAISYMLANTGMPETDVVAEVERYVVLPGQACAYKIGQLEILRLRERARQALGAGFDLAGFHDAVLGNGALPLELLEHEVEAWIAGRGDPARLQGGPRSAEAPCA